MNIEQIIEESQFKPEDFDSTAPFEAVHKFIENDFNHDVAIEKMSAYARGIGVKNFKSRYQKYLKGLKKIASQIVVEGATEFTGQPIELSSGEWNATDEGISRKSGFGIEWACKHPILPTKRLVNIDTGEQRLELAYARGGIWRSIVAAKEVISATNKITELSKYGIGVTSTNARAFVDYLSDMESINYDIIPEQKSIGRMGYVKGEGFSPYVEGLEFDGDMAFSAMYKTVHESGSFEKWKEIASKGRSDSLAVKIVLAASFASPLLSVVGALPFFVHMWCPEGGTGKTVTLMLAASVWGNPALGEYTKTFNATSAGLERLAAFLNHLPLCIDELQLTKKGGKGESNFSVYDLASGVSRTRSNKAGGLDATLSWCNTVITAGESSMNQKNTASGAVNRVVDIKCEPGVEIIKDGNVVANALRANYGFAGKVFVERLYKENLDELRVRYNGLYRRIQNSNTTDKQALSGAAIILADELMCQWIFEGSEKPITVEEIIDYLASKAEADVGNQAYEFICNWVATNQNKFIDGDYTPERTDTYGVIEEDSAFIIKNVLEEALKDGGYSVSSVVTSLRAKGLLRTDKDRNTRNKRIYKVKTPCYNIVIDNTEDDSGPEFGEDDIL